VVVGIDSELQLAVELAVLLKAAQEVLEVLLLLLRLLPLFLWLLSAFV